jgi:hypothetical protein
MIFKILVGLNVVMGIAAVAWFLYDDHRNEVKRGVWDKICLFFGGLLLFIFGLPVMVLLGAVIAFGVAALYAGCCAIFGEEAFSNFLEEVVVLIIGGFVALIVLGNIFTLFSAFL